MPEHLKALIVIVAIAAIVFWLAERPLCSAATAIEDYRRRRNVWFSVTLVAFVSGDYWVYAIAAMSVVALTALRDRTPLAQYGLLLLAIPPFDAEVPGFGLINYLLDLNHVRLLNLVILLPIAIRLMMVRAPDRNIGRTPGILLLAYLLLMVALFARAGNMTLVMRQMFYLFVDAWLPFYVAANALRSVSAFRDVAAAFALSASILAVVAMFEFSRGWLLYGALDEAMGQQWGFGSYLRRDGAGSLRAIATAGHPIVLGYVLMVGIAFMLVLQSTAKPRMLWHLGMVSLVIGLLASVSRGPWMGAVAMATVWLSLGTGAGKRMVRAAGICALPALVLLLSPLGASLIDLLPFVGSVDAETVEYRQQLFLVSMSVLAQSPIFGVPNYLVAAEMQQLVQGEGIIDMVNSYVAIALSLGVVGLLLFVSLFVVTGAAVYRTRARLDGLQLQAEQVGRALLAALVGVAVTIATVSSISVIPTIYWFLLGMGVAYTRSFSAAAMSHAAVGRAAPLRVPGSTA